jgi:hypothetical protein
MGSKTDQIKGSGLGTAGRWPLRRYARRGVRAERRSLQQPKRWHEIHICRGCWPARS